ncbi:unnamed protein product [Arctogadus glacialis]
MLIGHTGQGDNSGSRQPWLQPRLLDANAAQITPTCLGNAGRMPRPWPCETIGYWKGSREDSRLCLQPRCHSCTQLLLPGCTRGKGLRSLFLFAIQPMCCELPRWQQP